MSFEVKIDLERDMRNHLVGEITSLGYEHDGTGDLREVATEFRMLMQRHVEPKRRAIELASGIAAPRHLQAGFDAFCQAVREGRSVRPYQSRRTKDEAYRDLMLIDWGIQHFHLGTTLEQDGFVNRCDPLLFALVTSTHVYCVGFWSHGAWADQDIVGVVHDNWPDVIAKYRINGIVGLANTPSNEDIKKLRRAQVNSAFEPRPGVFYFPPGGGQTLSGHSAEAVFSALGLQRIVDHMTKVARERIKTEVLNEDAILTGYVIPGRLEVRDQAGNLIAWTEL